MININIHTETIGEEILKAASIQARIKNIIRETNKHFREVKRLKGFNPDPELFRNYQIGSLSYLERKFKDMPNNHTEGEQYYKCKLRVERELSKLVND